jgi:putative component of membrane protein insertase Oxa1/YidC/SpoIIIJ protein YidD
MSCKICITVVIVLFVSGKPVFAQNFNQDLQLVNDKQFFTSEEFKYYHGQYNDAHVLQTNKRNVFAKYNPFTLMLKGSMLLYQNVLSPQLSRQCPYEITCSNFCKQSIKEYGIIKGILIGADRIMRCNRISLLDIDPLAINETTGKIADPPSKYK